MTGNTMHFEVNEMIWTGCDSSGAAHPEAYMGSNTGMVAVGTPRDPEANNTPLGALDVDSGYVGANRNTQKGIYAISPVFTVVD